MNEVANSAADGNTASHGPAASRVIQCRRLRSRRSPRGAGSPRRSSAWHHQRGGDDRNLEPDGGPVVAGDRLLPADLHRHRDVPAVEARLGRGHVSEGVPTSGSPRFLLAGEHRLAKNPG
jgi:hypothetical protein